MHTIQIPEQHEEANLTKNTSTEMFRNPSVPVNLKFTTHTHVT